MQEHGSSSILCDLVHSCPVQFTIQKHQLQRAPQRSKRENHEHWQHFTNWTANVEPIINSFYKWHTLAESISHMGRTKFESSMRVLLHPQGDGEEVSQHHRAHLKQEASSQHTCLLCTSMLIIKKHGLFYGPSKTSSMGSRENIHRYTGQSSPVSHLWKWGLHKTNGNHRHLEADILATNKIQM